jgi:hypothetical protein
MPRLKLFLQVIAGDRTGCNSVRISNLNRCIKFILITMSSNLPSNSCISTCGNELFYGVFSLIRTRFAPLLNDTTGHPHATRSAHDFCNFFMKIKSQMIRFDEIKLKVTL